MWKKIMIVLAFLTMMPFYHPSLSMDSNERLFRFYKSQFWKMDRVLFDDFYDVCREENFSLPIALAVADAESEFYPKAYSSAGAIGLMQIMPYNADHPRLLYQTKYNIKVGVRLLKDYIVMSKYNLLLALKCYNYGPYNNECDIHYLSKIMSKISYFEPQKTIAMLR